MQRSNRVRRGLTAVESIVAIAIVAIMIQLALPGIQSARAGADLRFQMLTLALNTYTDFVAPVVSCSVKKDVLWPANGNLVDVRLEVDAIDDIDPDPDVTVFVYSDEPETGTEFDAVMPEPGVLELRAERDAELDGRVYLIIVTATDECGNQGYDCCTAVVPIHKKKKVLAQTLMQAAADEMYCLDFGVAPPGQNLIAQF